MSLLLTNILTYGIKAAVNSNSSTRDEFAAAQSKATKSTQNNRTSQDSSQNSGLFTHAAAAGPKPTPRDVILKARNGEILTDKDFKILATDLTTTVEYVIEFLQRPLNLNIKNEKLLFDAILEKPYASSRYVLEVIKKPLDLNNENEKLLFDTMIKDPIYAEKYVGKFFKEPLDQNIPQQKQLFDIIITDGYVVYIYVKKNIKRALDLTNPYEKKLFDAIMSKVNAVQNYIDNFIGRELDLTKPHEKQLFDVICTSPLHCNSYYNSYIKRPLDFNNDVDKQLLNGIAKNLSDATDFISNKINLMTRNKFDIDETARIVDFQLEYYNKFLIPQLLVEHLIVTQNADGTTTVAQDPKNPITGEDLARVMSQIDETIGKLTPQQRIEFSDRWHTAQGRLPDHLFPMFDFEWLPLFKSDYTTTQGIKITELTTSGDLKLEGSVLGHCVGQGGYASSCAQDGPDQGKEHIISFRGADGVATSTAEVRIVKPGEGISVSGTDFDIKIEQHKGKDDDSPSVADRAAMAEWIGDVKKGNVILTIKKLTQTDTVLGRVEHSEQKNSKVEFAEDVKYGFKTTIEDAGAVPTREHLDEVGKAIDVAWRIITKPTTETLYQITNKGAVLKGEITGRNPVFKTRHINGQLIQEPVMQTTRDPNTGETRTFQTTELVYKWLDMTDPNNPVDVTQQYNPQNIVETRKVVETGLHMFRRGLVTEVTVSVANGAVGANSKKLKIDVDPDGNPIKKIHVPVDPENPNAPHKFIPKSKTPKKPKSADLSTGIAYKTITINSSNANIKPRPVANVIIEQTDPSSSQHITTITTQHLKNDDTNIIEAYLVNSGVKDVTVRLDEGLDNQDQGIGGRYQIYTTTAEKHNEVAKVLGLNPVEIRPMRDANGNIVTYQGHYDQAKVEAVIIAETARIAAQAEAEAKARAEAETNAKTVGKNNQIKTDVKTKQIKFGKVATNAYGHTTNQAQAVTSFTKMTQAFNAGDFEAAYNNLLSCVTSEIFATMKYWAPQLANLIGKEVLEKAVKTSLPFAGVGFGVKEICEVCFSEDNTLKKKCAMTIVSNIIEVLPQFVPGLGFALKFVALPDLTSIMINQLVGLLSAEYRAPERSVESIIKGTNEVIQGDYAPKAPQPARSGY